MKRLLLAMMIIVFPVKGSAQINNLKDLLEISELNVKEMVSELQYIWKLHPPIQDTSEKGFVTERYTFTYNKDNKKQVLKKCGKMDLNSRVTMWLTNFISNDKDLLNRITKNLIYQGFELKGKQKVNSMYEDGNRIVTIQTQSDDEYKLPKDCYSIIVIVNKTTNSKYKSTNMGKRNIPFQKVNPLDNISNSKNSTSQKISVLTNISDLIRIAKTSFDKISTVLNSDWETVVYPKGTEPLNEWYSYKNSNQVVESYIGYDNGIGKDIRVTTFKFSDTKLLNEIITELSKSEFELMENTKDYYNFENNNNIIEIYLDNEFENKRNYKIEISTFINKSKVIIEKKI
ncbi:hypothetical protein [Flavobacterium ajazii]|uniref:hypothetical protein n=1 Tax=Flavobacterium ajazii TaxID=2692318 RepID=UPI0013D4B800|nr:hypothetical protein [Flavobacterium ajazii]